ncbi:MAG: rod-binding protein [Pseudomonadota bacterium]
MIETAATSLLSPNASSLTQAATNRMSVDDAAEEFEAVMLTALLKPVFESIETPAPFGGGSGEQMWRGVLVEQYAKEMAAAGGIGIADQVRAELLRIQETGNREAAP